MEFEEDMFIIAYVFLLYKGKVLDSEKEVFYRFMKACCKTTNNFVYLDERILIARAEDLFVSVQKDEYEDSFDKEPSFVDVLGKTGKKPIKGLKDALKEKYYVKKVIQKFVSDSHYNTKKKLSFIWLLVNMAYAKGECYTKEKELLEYTFEKLKAADKALLAEFMDTAVALLAIKKKREYVYGTDYEESVEGQCKAESKVLENSIEALTKLIK